MSARHVHVVVVMLGALAITVPILALAGVAPLAALATAPVALGGLVWAVAAGFTALLLLIQRQGLVFYWRDKSTKISLDELGVFLGLLALPPAHVALAVVASSLLNQIFHRRALSKATFNVGQYAIAALAAVASVAALRSLHVPEPWAAAGSPIIFSGITALLVSALFAQLEGSRALTVFRERFGRLVVVGATLGMSLGVAVYALYQLHPIAVLAMIPAFAYLRRFGRLSEWADDEITTHRLVASVSAELAGRADLDRVGDRILATCEELFDCGEASLILASAPGVTPRVWRAEFGRSDGFGGVSAEISAPDGGRLGALNVFPKIAQRRYGEREQQLLRTVAATAASAAANAHALRAAEEANAELGASERRYRSLFDTAHVLLHVLDDTGRVLDANAAAEAALGRSAERQRGARFAELVVGLEGEALVVRLLAGEEIVGLETRMRSADGSDLCVLLDARTLPEEPQRHVVFARDITPLKKLEEELRRAMAQQHDTIKRLENMNRELEQFTLWTTHDMREPLRSIGTIAGFLHEDIGRLDVEEARDMARRIAEGAERLKQRVKALHAFSLIVQRDDEFQDVNMQLVVDEVVLSLETKIRERSATIVLPATPFPIVRAQAHRIDQVVANLVENALKYGRDVDAVVEIGFQESASEWRIYVRDDGPGIPPSYHERIFQLFQRGPNAREVGSGAGLAIVKRIAEQHGGRAWVESREGEGAAFYVALPKPAPTATVPAIAVGVGRKRF